MNMTNASKFDRAINCCLTCEVAYKSFYRNTALLAEFGRAADFDVKSASKFNGFQPSSLGDEGNSFAKQQVPADFFQMPSGQVVMNGQLSRRLHIRYHLTSPAWTLDCGLILTIGTITGLALQISTGAPVIACLRNVSRRSCAARPRGALADIISIGEPLTPGELPTS